MNDLLLTSNVCTALMRIGTRMATVFDRKFHHLDLTQAQFRLLLAICEAGESGVSPSDLADILLIERATVTVLTARMADRGLVARTPGANRRTHFLTLTEEGLALVRRAAPSAIDLADKTLREFERADLEQARSLLAAIEACLRRMGDEKDE